MAALSKTDLDFLASLPASTAEPTEGTREQRRRAEDLPWGLLRQGRRTDLGDFVVAQQADLERLTAERATLLAPAEGVDLEEVLTNAETLAYGRKHNTFDPFTAEGSLLLEALADAAPALARALMAERAEVACLRADLEEARLTLAAEQGRPEGAPSEGWEWDSHAREWWRNTPVGRITVSALGGRADLYGWSVDYPGQRHAIHRPTARAAMKDTGAVQP